jgi:hypothetical protein
MWGAVPKRECCTDVLHVGSQRMVLLTRALVLVLSLPLALVRCGSASPPSVPDDRQSERSNEGVDAGCGATFVANEELRPLVEQAAERWSAATGCAITAGDSGAEIRLAASIPTGEGGREAPGSTNADRSLVLIHESLSPERRSRTINHELGHALGGLHTESDGVLWGKPGRRDVIDDGALETVCAVLPCVLLSPEEP